MARESIDGIAEVFERCAATLVNPIVVDRGRRQGDLL